MLGGRPVGMVAREALAPRNYRALWRMRALLPDFGSAARRYFLGGGEYPWACRVRTPLGEVAPTLHSHHDMWTVNEVFCREDYRLAERPAVVVDVGSNIGLSALYFLTRHSDVRCHLYEPVPVNVQRLRENLRGFEDRFELEEVAVDATAGRASFGVEPTGRYGGLGVATGKTIEVRCAAINDVLAAVLEAEGRIDVLKLDTEGSELRIARAIARELLERIDLVYLELARPEPLWPERFEATFANETLALRRRSSSHLM